MKSSAAEKTLGLARRFLREAQVNAYEHFILEMNGDGELCVGVCSEIREYTESCILLYADKYFITIDGRGLYFKSYSKNTAVIAGSIEKISFMKRD